MNKDEALKTIRDARCTSPLREAIETLIPELKESEDERIRKALIGLVSTVGEYYLPKLEVRNKMLVYLERQKEQKEELVYRLNGLMQDYIKEGKDDEEKEHRLKCYQLFWDALEDTNFFEQKEQKPILFIPKFRVGDKVISTKNEHLTYVILEVGHINELGNPDYTVEIFADGKSDNDIKYIECRKMDEWGKLVEQKPAEWSEDYREEDIQTRFAFYTYKDDPSTLYLSNVFVEEASRNHGFGTRILRAAEKVAETIGATTISLKVKQNSPANKWYRKNGYGYVAFEDGYDWLGKNLEYMKPNNQEWGEEDERMMNRLIDRLNFIQYNTRTDGTSLNISFVNEIAWLKSLRPQPSEDKKILKQTIYKAAMHELAIKFMNYLDENRPEGKMSLSNAECEDINQAFVEKDWAKILRYTEKYRPHWKPSEEQMRGLAHAINLDVYDAQRYKLDTLYNDLKKLM